MAGRTHETKKNQLSAHEAVRKLLAAIGEQPERPGLRKTPERMIRAYTKLFSGYGVDPVSVVTVFPNDGYDEMILLKDIEFYSMCEHHLLPFFGRAHIAYIPDKQIIGLSKLPRLIEVFSRRLQTQERLTNQLADTIDRLLRPKGVGVVLEGRHLCMMARGVEKQHGHVTTSALRGLIKDRTRTRSEFLRLLA